MEALPINNGKKTIEVVQFIDTLFKDISHLLNAVDQGMQSLSLTSLWGTACYFSASRAVALPSNWMPHVFTRVYVPVNNNRDYARFAFFNVYLSPKHLNEPVAIWGTAKRRQLVEFYPIWNNRILASGGPSFLRKATVDSLTATADVPEIFEHFEYAARPLLMLDSADVVSTLVVQPLSIYSDFAVTLIEDLP